MAGLGEHDSGVPSTPSMRTHPVDNRLLIYPPPLPPPKSSLTPRPPMIAAQSAASASTLMCTALKGRVPPSVSSSTTWSARALSCGLKSTAAATLLARGRMLRGGECVCVCVGGVMEGSSGGDSKKKSIDAWWDQGLPQSPVPSNRRSRAASVSSPLQPTIKGCLSRQSPPTHDQGLPQSSVPSDPRSRAASVVSPLQPTIKGCLSRQSPPTHDQGLPQSPVPSDTRSWAASVPSPLQPTHTRARAHTHTHTHARPTWKSAA